MNRCPVTPERQETLRGIRPSDLVVGGLVSLNLMLAAVVLFVLGSGSPQNRPQTGIGRIAQAVPPSAIPHPYATPQPRPTVTLPPRATPPVIVSPKPTPTPAPPAKPVPPAPKPTQPPLATYMAPLNGVFGGSSEWRRDVSRAPLATNSSGEIAGLAKQVADNYGGVATFNAHAYSTTFSLASPHTPAHNVTWDDCQHKGYTPAELYTPSGGAHFADVPIPDGTTPSAGSDAELTVWRPSTDQLWEFWRTHHESDGWHACWGGRMDRVSKSPGFFGSGMGATATGLPNAGGMVRIQEAFNRSIDHAMALQLIDTETYSVVSYPAQRSDGYNPDHVPDRIAEGTRLRLDPTLNVSALHLSPIATMIAKAAQRYGFIVTDKSGSVAIEGESPLGYTAANGADPWDASFAGGKDYSVLSGFPWDRLQALPTDWGKPRG